ncbi:MAG: N-acetylmuramoyl-L-alanine amidase [Dorea sp.]
MQNRWSGAGYHFWFARTVPSTDSGQKMQWALMPGGSNSDSLGICFEGSYMTETMPQAQINAGRELLGYLKGKHGFSKVQAHRDVCSTNCPGTNFPFTEIGEQPHQRRLQHQRQHWLQVDHPIRQERCIGFVGGPSQSPHWSGNRICDQVAKKLSSQCQGTCLQQRHTQERYSCNLQGCPQGWQ